MKITRIEATSHRVPAKVPLLHEPIMREIIFVRVETDAGVIGYGLTGCAVGHKRKSPEPAGMAAPGRIQRRCPCLHHLRPVGVFS